MANVTMNSWALLMTVVRGRNRGNHNATDETANAAVTMIGAKSEQMRGGEKDRSVLYPHPNCIFPIKVALNAVVMEILMSKCLFILFGSK